MTAARRFFSMFTTLVLGCFSALLLMGWVGAQAHAALLPAGGAPWQFGPAALQAAAPELAMSAPLLPPGERPAALDTAAAPRDFPGAVHSASSPAGLRPALPAAPGSLYIVLNTNDSGAGSLRDAVTQANAAIGHDQIQFSLAGCPCVISLLSTLAPNDELTISGPGASLLTLSGGGTSRIFTASGVPLHLSSLTLVNGFHATQGGGAISSASLTLQNVVVRNSSAAWGGGVEVSGALAVTDTVFMNNTALTSGGGGAYVSQKFSALRTDFIDNSAHSDGGGAYLSGDASITGGRFDGNQTVFVKSYGGGGGLMAFGVTTISATQFLTNTTPAWGGGAYLANFAAGTVNGLSGATFRGNQADWGGGGLFQWFSASITNTDFLNNRSNTNGGGLYAGYAGNFAIRLLGGSIQGNQAAIGGGLFGDGSFTLQSVSVYSNTATNGRGGGAATLGSAAVADSTFAYNTVITAGYGGGLYAQISAAITDTTFLRNRVLGFRSGGGLAVGNTQGVGSANLLRLTFTENSSARGYAGGLISYGATRLTDSTFTGNTAWNDGGGAWVGGALTLNGGLFQNNRTLLNEGNGGGGGLLSFQRAVISGTRFISNTTADWGGGAYLYAPVQAASLITNAVFISNTAASGGGGGLFAWYTATLSAPTFTGNYALGRGGGLYAGYQGNFRPHLSGGIFRSNSGVGGGGLYSYTDITLNGTEFYSNTARNGNGGGAWTLQSARVANSIFSFNDTLAGGNSGGLDTGGNLWLTDTLFSYNQAWLGSGGGSGAGGSVRVLRGEYRQNTANDDGGGLLAYGTATLSGAHFYTNTASDLGGGLAASSVTGQDTLLQGNDAVSCGGGVFANVDMDLSGGQAHNNRTQGSGGGLCLPNGGGTGRLSGVLISGNQAGPAGSGGGMYSGVGALSVFGGVFADNSAGDLGGGMLAAQAAITGTWFENNTAGSRGGGLLLNAGSNLLRQAAFVGNRAAAGGGLALQGSAGGSLVNSLFARNSAGGGGGQALYVDGSGALQIRHTTIASSTLAAGSAVYVNAGSLTLENTILANHAFGLARIGGSVTLTNPLFHGNTVNTQGAGIIVNGAVNGSPAFFNPAGDDYHLGLGSLAFNAGINAGVTSDYDGDLRPQGGGMDIGYDEAVTPSGLNFTHTAPQPVGQTVLFGATAAFGQGVLFTWDFGDGANGAGQAASHAYAQPGVYPVTLTAANAAGWNLTVKNVIISGYRLYLPSMNR